VVRAAGGESELAGATAAQIGPELRAQAERAFAQLEDGLG